jgi:hypothetical protein
VWTGWVFGSARVVGLTALQPQRYSGFGLNNSQEQTPTTEQYWGKWYVFMSITVNGGIMQTDIYQSRWSQRQCAHAGCTCVHAH